MGNFLLMMLCRTKHHELKSLPKILQKNILVGGRSNVESSGWGADHLKG